MDEKNKHNKLFTAIYILLISLIFASEIIFTWASNANLKSYITIIAGFLALIWLVFSVFYWTPGKFDFQDPKYTKLGRTAGRIMLYTIILGQAANTFIESHFLRGKLLVIEGMFILISIALYVIDWRQRWVKIRRKE